MKKYAIIVLLWLVSLSVYAQTESLNEKITAIVNHKMQNYQLPGLAVGVVQNGQVIYSKGFGVTNIRTQKAVSNQHLFHVASVSKLFTALAVMKLVDQKKLSLNDRLLTIAPLLKFKTKQAQQITIKQLLNHTAGLPDIHNYHWGKHHKDTNALRDDLHRQTIGLKYAPGTRMKYSNLGYDILGYVISLVSGQSFEDYLKEHILDKAGMKNSDFRYFKTNPKLRVSPHTRKLNKIKVRKTYPYTREHAPSSTLNASVHELNLWMMYFLKNLAHTPSHQQMLYPSFANVKHMGLGFQLTTIQNKLMVGHFGGDRGFRSCLMMIPSEKIGIVVLGNCDYNEDFRSEVIKAIANEMLKK